MPLSAGALKHVLSTRIVGSTPVGMMGNRTGVVLKWEDRQDWMRGREKPGMAPGFLSWLTGWWSCTAFGYYFSSLLTCGERSLPGRHASNVYSSCQVLHPLHLVRAPTGVLRCPQMWAPNNPSQTSNAQNQISA